MFDIAELRAKGYDPKQLGMERIADHVGRFEIPIVDVDADMKSRYDVDLYHPTTDDMNNPVLIIGGVFQDPHPDDWWERVHTAEHLFIVAGDTPTFVAAAAAAQAGQDVSNFDFGRILTDSYIGRVAALMIRAYDTGVGTKMPGA